MTEETLLRHVYAVDTKAGHALRALLLRAKLCPAYAEQIGFGPISYIAGISRASSALSGLFLWDLTDNLGLWSKVCNILCKKEENSGT